MGLNYGPQVISEIIGSKSGTTRTAVALTAAYTDRTKTFEVGGYSKLNLDILYTMGASETSNYILLKIEGSPDGTNFYNIPNETVSGGTSTLTAREFKFVGTDADTATISIGLDIFYKYVKVSVKEVGVSATYGTVYIESTLNGF